MKTLKRILLPTDFSERAGNALDQAIHLADRIGGRLLILHVYHRLVAEEDYTDNPEKLEKSIDKKFAKLLKEHPQLSRVPHEFRKELGLSLDNILDTVQNEAIDLLVMATKGASGFDEIWGTKTAKIIKRVQVPVFVIPDKTSLKRLKKVGLACDYSTSTVNHEMQFLIDLAREMELAVDVITLNRDAKTMIRQELDNREDIINLLDEVKSDFHFTDSNSVEDGLVEYSLANNIDLIAILPKSYSFIERLFNESLTQKMTFHSPIPLLVLK
ncbi:universal stress protein [Marinoscillum sp.]|uniref:universal stress protein n=1 Tax=Marinoscillum sp. TaxID=2024838 RepID=UPI003BA90061